MAYQYEPIGTIKAISKLENNDAFKYQSPPFISNPQVEFPFPSIIEFMKNNDRLDCPCCGVKLRTKPRNTNISKLRQSIYNKTKSGIGDMRK